MGFGGWVWDRLANVPFPHTTFQQKHLGLVPWLDKFLLGGGFRKWDVGAVS